jgi:peptidyl-prolyl cis-trans isomerase SurA
MNKNIILTVFLFFLTISLFAQKDEDVLLTIDDRPVLASEFKRVYLKNLDLVLEESQKSVDGYLQLFIDYKLKVVEAYSQGFHESDTYKKDFSKYEDQLSRNYIFEDKVTSELAEEAFKRNLEEIDASHILIMVNYDAVPQDTLAAYNKIKGIRDRALKEDFTALARETSEEPGIEESGGHLGYFTAFALVYPFETAAYTTEVGEVSDIIRTQFGYHIIKVHDRRMKEPEITVSHIMIGTKGGTTNYVPEVRIGEIYALVEQGNSFESLAKQYSDDKNSAKNGGKLKRFSKGDLRSSIFEDAAYNLKNPGDVSKPIKTKFGWHIIRLEEKHPLPTYEEKREILERRVKEGSRSKIVTQAVNVKIKEKFGFVKGASYSPYFDTYVGDEIVKRKWVYDTIPASENKKMFTIGELDSYFDDFARFIQKRQYSSKKYMSRITLMTDFYDEFETFRLKAFFRERLELENEEYAGIISEYRDGLLIFDLMGKNVWRKAKKDSVGQLRYFEEHKLNYQWKQRVDVEILATTREGVVSDLETLMKEGKTGEEIKDLLNKDKEVSVLLTKGIFEIDRRELPSGFLPNMGVSKIYTENESFIIVNVRKIIPQGPRTFEEIKGRVLSDYQTFIEEQWMEQLRAKFKVEINKKTLKKIKKELNF